MPDLATGTLATPYPGAPITSDFGPRRAPLPGASTFHTGIDYGVGIGTPTRAMDGGTVIFASRAGSAGNVVVIDHGNGAYTRYLHLDSFGVRVGDTVEQGDVIARSGDTGRGTGPHGHVELRFGGRGDFRGGPGSTARAVDFEALLNGGRYTDRIVLKQGDQGSGVTRLQEQLIQAGFGGGLGTSGPNGNGADGDYGERTVAAVMAFQRAQGFTGAEVDGKFGLQTRTALTAAIERGDTTPTPVDPTPAPVDPAPRPTGDVALDTPGAFAATSSSDIVSTTNSAGRVALSGATLEQTRDVARAVFGDSVGAELLSALGAQNGDERIFLQRTIALARHEGAFSFGRENADPAAGFNVGTFQEGGGSIRSQAESNVQFEGRVQAGLAVAERTLGREIDPSTLTAADRDVMAFVGWRQERSESVLPDLQAFARRNPNSTVAERMAPFSGTAFTGDPSQLFRILADPTLTREQTIEGVSYLTQGGIRDIGRNVHAWTTPGGAELYVDLDGARARAQEPDALRSEPAFPTLRRGDAGPAVTDLQNALVTLGYDLGTTGRAGNGVDGDFGGRTLAAVQAFQREAGFSDTGGVVGPQTWGTLAARVSREVTVGTEPTPTTDPVPPATAPAEPLGTTAPEEYAVRQFRETVRDATWTEGAARVTMSDDAARWVADTETPGDARVQLTFPGAYDRVSQGLTARPGSDVAAVLDAARQAENGIQVRTAEQNGSVGTYVLVDEAAILSRFPTVDAFVAAARQDLAIQDAVQTELTDVQDAQTPAEARAVLDRNPAAAGFINGTLDTLQVDLGRTLPPDQAAGFTDTLYALASNTGRQTADGPYSVPISRDLVRDEAARAGLALTDGQTDNAVTAMEMTRTAAEDNPAVAEAVSTLRIEAAEGRASETPSQGLTLERDATSRTSPAGGDGVDRNVASEPVLVTV